jgi:hypothetical protein
MSAQQIDATRESAEPVHGAPGSDPMRAPFLSYLWCARLADLCDAPLCAPWMQ